ncbi:MAG: HU family DNA-binding protein [Bacteroidales bacterium]|jgi:predicted histone-like DNA-binding protein|nr:HU family DNA-binding protein [Bacteroidales bacterium]
MSYHYKVKKKKANLSGKTTYKYYATSSSNGVISMDQAAKEIEDNTTLSKSDVISVVTALSSLIENKIRNGYSVKLDGLGTFSLSITSEGFVDAKKCIPTKVRPSKICFRADKKLKEKVFEVTFEKDSID